MTVALLFLLATLRLTPAAADSLVRVERIPDGGLQPEVAVDSRGLTHLLYFVGDPAAGDLYYRHSVPPDGGQTAPWSTPVRINSQSGSAMAIGTVRGGHLALGAGGVHVAWMSALKESPGMFYSRDDGDGVFEPQRNLTRLENGLDGGGSLAADDEGNVYVAWHAGHDGESTRRLFVASSTDSGRSFNPEQRANPVEAGACGCCGMRAGASPGGELWILYRSATELVHRDMQLLQSSDGGRSFTQRTVHPWELAACPMSTSAMAPTVDGALMAWETEGQIHWSRVAAGADSSLPTEISTVAGDGGIRKHPAIAVDSDGRIALTWAENTGWNRGGNLAWQVYDTAGNTLESGSLEAGVPTWSRAAVVARPEGGFLVLH